MNESIEDLEKYLGLKTGFLFKIQSEDDWSFIIKLYSLIEAATSSLLTENLLHPELLDAFSSLQMGTTKDGKLSFVKALKLMPENHIKYVETLGWLRNKFVHNVSSSNNDLKKYLSNLSQKRRKECEKNLHLIKIVTFNNIEQTGKDFFIGDPRSAIFISGQMVLESIRQRTIGGQQNRQFIEQQLKNYKETHGTHVIRANEFKLDNTHKAESF